MPDLSYYIKKFSTLKVNSSKVYGNAPHKPILLLSIIQSIEQNEITENKIYITPELVSKFKDNWQALITSSHFSPDFAKPYFHLQSSGFWFIKPCIGATFVLPSALSFSALKYATEYAYFADDLYTLLNDAHSREILKQTLLTTYFKNKTVPPNSHNLFHEIEKQILHESPIAFQRKTLVADEEETFIRNGAFKKIVPKIYNYTCCISGMRIVATRDIQMIDACHIVPFSETHDDHITNGISLSPNFHRAFDRHLITIDEDYRVVISPHFTESGSHLIREFEGKQIHLPYEKHYHPSKDNLTMHHKRFQKVNY